MDVVLVESLQKLLHGLAQALVDYEGQVVIESAVEAESVRFVLRVNPSDVRKLVGGQGRVARSLRTLLVGAGQKNACRFSLEILGHKAVDATECPLHESIVGL